MKMTMQIGRLKHTGVILWCITILLFAAEVTAADQTAAPDEDAGNFNYPISLNATYIYDDNIYAQNADALDDSILLISPRIAAKSLWDRHNLTFRAGADLGLYSTYSKENYEDLFFKLRGRYDLSDKTSVFGGIGYSLEHEGRDSPEDNLSGLEPTTYDSTELSAGVSHDIGLYSLRLGMTSEWLDYDNVPAVDDSLIYNDDRDRRLDSVGLQLKHSVTDASEWYARTLYNRRDYDEALSLDGYQRDSTGYRAALGFKYKAEQKILFDGYLGLMTQNYDDPRFSRVDAIDFGGKLVWLLNSKSRLNLLFNRTLNETTVAGSSGYLLTDLGGTLEYNFMPKTIGSLSLSKSVADYQEITRQDDLLSWGVGVKHLPNKNLYVSADYKIFSRDTSDAYLSDGMPTDEYDFDRQRIYLTVGLTF
ncbi:MAG: hypothetical protein OI74_13650 [Gammaproteobacteria bacterium (ex Lamellibrachia satsuma)]|nr:MAG: hypothetical protein OI74_13650 [Gammaproteobacteria bacterium (ex Lamellibrachia satsuma)]RRS36163.1 MAG: hypothetical protein NV67_08675 [Gammaproteobacteria bacterium (ex Lamellibrachia satsuma)]